MIVRAVRPQQKTYLSRFSVPFFSPWDTGLGACHAELLAVKA